MNRNRDNLNAVETAATVAIGAACAYGAYKLLGSFFGSSDPQPNQSSNAPTVYRQAQTYSDDSEDDSSHQNLYVVDSLEKLRDPLKKLEAHCNESKVLAFDCEWNSDTSRHPVALLQLCSHRGLRILVRLSQLPHFPSDLEALLEDRTIIKVGVAPYTDARFLQQDYQVRVTRTLDLRYMARLAGCQPGRLATMSEQYLGRSLDKGYQCSDWEETKLSRTQIQYAAADVDAGMDLLIYFARNIAPGKSLNYVTQHYCGEYIDKNYGPA